jgi:hypothetical protein
MARKAWKINREKMTNAKTVIIKGSASIRGSPSNALVSVYIASFPRRIEDSNKIWKVIKSARKIPVAL